MVLDRRGSVFALRGAFSLDLLNVRVCRRSVVLYLDRDHISVEARVVKNAQRVDDAFLGVLGFAVFALHGAINA